MLLLQTIVNIATALEREVSTFVFSSSEYLSSSTCSTSSSGGNSSYYCFWYNGVWFWTVWVLGLYTLVSVLSNAFACYQFIVAWNLISRANRFDVELLHRHKERFMTRRKQIQENVYTRLYSEYLFHNDNNPDTTTNISTITTQNHNKTSSEQKDENPTQAVNSEDNTLSLSKSSSSASSNSSSLANRTTCPICLGDFEASDMVSSSSKDTNCCHLFHEKCLSSWLTKQPSCPCCRFQILPSSSPLSSSPRIITLNSY